MSQWPNARVFDWSAGLVLSKNRFQRIRAVMRGIAFGTVNRYLRQTADIIGQLLYSEITPVFLLGKVVFEVETFFLRCKFIFSRECAGVHHKTVSQRYG